jgi:hypothetical protein
MTGLQYIGQSGASGSGSTSTFPVLPIGLVATGTTTPIYTIMAQPLSVRTIIGDYQFLNKIVDTLTFPNDGDITAINFGDIVAISGTVSIPVAFPKLVSVSAPNLIYTVGGVINPNNSTSLTTIDYPLLEYGGVALNTCPTLTTINLPALKSGTINLGLIGAIPALPSMTDPRGITLQAAFAGTSIAWNQMIRNWGVLFLASTSLTSFTMNSLTLTDNISITAPVLSTFSLAALVRIEGITSNIAISVSSAATALTNFTLPTTLKKVQGNVSFLGGALTQASVDNILVRLAALDGTNGTTAYSNRAVDIKGTASTPSATGLAAKATLVARGCTVTNN